MIPESVTTIEDLGYQIENLIVYCKENSVAHKYAVEHGIKYSFSDMPLPTVPPIIIPTETPQEEPTITPQEEPTITPTDKPINLLVSNIILIDKAKTIDVKKKYTIIPIISPSNATNKSLTFKSTNSRIATVNNKGVVTAKRVGQARIIISSNDGSLINTEVTITVRPTIPKKFKAKKLTYSSVKLTWKKDRYVTGYEIYRSTKKNGGFKKIKTVVTIISKSSHINWSLKPNKKYFYKIRAYDEIGNKKIRGKYTGIKSVKL
jgi:uncharacterized protein YjdB